MAKTSRPRSRRSATLKIATFNINNVRKRLPNLLAWLHQSKPDIVCLQELKTAQAKFPAEMIDGADICAAVAQQGHESGATNRTDRSSFAMEPILSAASVTAHQALNHRDNPVPARRLPHAIWRDRKSQPPFIWLGSISLQHGVNERAAQAHERLALGRSL